MGTDLEYLVYEIDETVTAVELNKEKIENLEKTMNIIISKTEKQSVKFLVDDIEDEKHPVVRVTKNVWGDMKNNKIDKEVFLEQGNYLASLLLEAEFTKDGEERNKNIKEGMLFLKVTKNQLSIIKLESKELMDKKTFQLREGLDISKDYYKIAIIKNMELKGIKILDKNKKVSKYWAEDFLRLSRARTAQSNTEEILSLLNKDELFSEEILKSSDYQNIRINTLDFLENNKSFSQIDLFSALSFSDKKINSDNFIKKTTFENIDDTFEIDKKLVLNSLQGKIRVSKDIEIFSERLEHNIKVKNFKLIDGRLSIKVDKTYIDEIKSLIGETINDK